MTLTSSSRATEPRLALLVIAVVFAILNADITTVNVALVTLGKDLHADLADLQWGLNSYMLAFAALIVAAGRVADVFGRRRCLLAGAILFAVASLLCGRLAALRNCAHTIGSRNRTGLTRCRWSADGARGHGYCLHRLWDGAARLRTRDIGRRIGRRSIDGTAPGWFPYSRSELAMGVSHQPAIDRCDNDRHASFHSRVAR